MFADKDQPAQDAALTCRPADSSEAPRSSTNSGKTRKNAPFIFSSLRALFPAPQPQTPPLHPLAHSFTHNKNLTLVFPFTSALFLRSFAEERKLTSLLSCACARFGEYRGWQRNPSETHQPKHAPSEPQSAADRKPLAYASWPRGVEPQARMKRGCGLYLQPAQITTWAVLAARKETGRNPSRMNTYAKCAANPRGMRTSKIIELKASCNEHLQKNGGGVGVPFRKNLPGLSAFGAAPLPHGSELPIVVYSEMNYRTPEGRARRTP
jgi:hypothetical protein